MVYLKILKQYSKKVFDKIKPNHYLIYLKSLKNYFKQFKNKPWLIRLQKTYSVLWCAQKYVTVTAFIFFLSLVAFAQLSYYLSMEEGDEDYTPIIPKEDLPFFASLFLRAFPSVSQALGELLMLPDQYGAMDEDLFSGPLKTQLRRNLLLRFVYLNFRARVWTDRTSERIRDNVDLNYDPSCSHYSLWNKASQDCDWDETKGEN